MNKRYHWIFDNTERRKKTMLAQTYFEHTFIISTPRTRTWAIWARWNTRIENTLSTKIKNEQWKEVARKETRTHTPIKRRTRNGKRKSKDMNYMRKVFPNQCYLDREVWAALLQTISRHTSLFPSSNLVVVFSSLASFFSAGNNSS